MDKASGANPLPKTYPSEMRTYTDALTGRTVTQLTADPKHHNVHLYFTENAFTRGGREVYFTSDRDTPGVSNVFSVNLDTGIITRVTGYTDQSANHFTKTPDSALVMYSHGRDAVLHDVKTGETRVIYTFPEGYVPGRLSINCDRTLVGALMNEDVRVEHGINYVGFEEKMYRVKRSRIDFIPLADGVPGEPRIGVRETCELGHLQFSPTDPSLCMYCHEGPWHLVTQRIFIVDTRTMEIYPCFRQGKQDSVGHEFWTRDGRVFLDNRGPGHDGTITSSRTQAVAKEESADPGFSPYVALADKDGRELKRYPLKSYCNHYHSDSTMQKLVGDDIDNIVSIDLSQTPARVETLCEHKTSWYGQYSHCHPTISWDDKLVLFASDRDGMVQLYLTDWN